MGVGDIFNSAVSGAANAVNDRPVYSAALAGAAGGVGGEALERLLRKFEESDGDFDPEDPEAVRRRRIRRAALIGAGVLAGGTGAALLQGNRAGFDEGVLPGVKKLVSSVFQKNWRHAGPQAVADAAAQTYGPLRAPKAAIADITAHGTRFGNRTASLAAFEKAASSLYFDSTIPLQQATYTMLSDPFLSASAKVGMTGLLGGTAQSTGAGLFSGADLARSAVRVGAGAVEGYALGKVMGTLFALPDSHVKKLSRAGAVADAVYSTGLFR